MMLTNARIQRLQGRMVLAIDIDGQSVVVDTEANKLARYGALYLGPQFEDILPIVTLEVEGRKQSFRGCATDARLLALFQSYWEMANSGDVLREQPLDIPEA